MPTPQVSNPATLFTNPAPTGRKADASNSSQSFEQVFSREVAGRQPTQAAQPAAAPARKDAPAAPDKAQQPAAAGSAAAQQAGARANAGETKQAARNKSTAEKTSGKDEAAETGEAREARETAAQSPEDLLAMVADLVQMTTPAAGAAEVLPQDAQAMVDPALLLAAAGMLRGDQGAVRLDKPETAADTETAGKALGLDTDARRAGPKDLLLDQTPAAQVDSDARRTGPKDLLLDQTPAAQVDSDARRAGPKDLLLDQTPAAQVATDAGNASADDLAALAAKGQELMLGADSESASAGFTAALQDVQAQAPAGAQALPQLMQMQAAARAMETKAADRLTPAVGSPGWDQALGQKVVWMVAGEQQSASLTLNPPDLGPLQVVLNVSNSQASATFSAAQPEVRQALEAALPKLRDMLGEAGIQLGQATVNSGSPNQQNQQGQSFASRHGNQGNGGADAGAATVQPGRAPASSGGIGMVDTFV